MKIISISIFLLFLSVKLYSQTFYIGWTDEEVQKDIASRETKDAVVQYLKNGDKYFRWKDIQMKSEIMVLFNNIGKVSKTLIVPFTPEVLSKYKTHFYKTKKVLSNDVWLHSFNDKNYVIRMQYMGPNTNKYGFFVTDYNSEVWHKEMNELVEKFKKENKF